MDRGFNAMIPEPKEVEPEQKSIYDYGINFTLFGKQFVLSFKVNNTRRNK